MIKEICVVICINLMEKLINCNLIISGFLILIEVVLRNKDIDDDGNSKICEDIGCRECF